MRLIGTASMRHNRHPSQHPTKVGSDVDREAAIEDRISRRRFGR
jgi:hypothetical protein